MAYFSQTQDGIDRWGKVLAGILCAAILLVFAVVFFGLFGGVLAFLMLESALIAVDYLVSSRDDVPGTVR